jgi:hypothetical protein
MKLKKSFGSLILFLVFLITSLGPVAVFASPTNVDWQDPLARMKQIDVIDSSVTNGDSVLTRGDFAKAIIAISGSSDLASTMDGSTIYPDIDPNSALSGDVNALANMNLMYGMADGNFHPELPINYADACTILVKLLGYTDSDLTGTWPNNYTNKAKKLKLTTDINFNSNNNLTVWAAALMFDRLLGTNIKSTSAASAPETYLQSVNLYGDYTIMDTPQTSTNVANGSVLTDKGVLYTSGISTNLAVGNTYRLGVTNGDIDTVYGVITNTQSITVSSATGDTVYYNSNNGASSMTLPSGVIYYYHGTQESYTNLANLLKVDTTIIFTYDSTNTGYASAVIVDPLYSKPQIALNFDPTSNSLGDITFDPNTPIVKNGQSATKNDIEDMDAVYSVTDVNGQNRKIQIFENNIQGNITEFLTNASSATGIQIDNTSYNYSSDMDLSNITSFNIGDLVEAIQGYDGNIVALRSISQKTGTLVGGVTILGNSKTSDNLTDDEVLAIENSGSTPTVYNCLNGVQNLNVGAKYDLYISGNNITKVQKSDNTIENYSVTSVLNSNITCTNDAGQSETITLPQASVYYYHGQKEPDYNTALNVVQPYSSIILAKDSSGAYDYAVIVDPYFSDPQPYVDDTNNIISEISQDNGVFIYRNGQYGVSLDSLNDDDVVYFVSDIWNKNRYIYVNESTVYGKIDSFAPNKINATSITVNGVNYQFSQYFNKSQLKTTYASLAANDYITLILGYDGEVVEIAPPVSK